MDLTHTLIGKVVTFTTRAPSLLGASFNRVKVLGILDRDTALNYRDVTATHINLYPTIHALDPTFPPNATDYLYIKIQYEDGRVDVLGWLWLDTNSIVEITSASATVKVDNITLADIPRIRNALLSIGIGSFTITTPTGGGDSPS